MIKNIVGLGKTLKNTAFGTMLRESVCRASFLVVSRVQCKLEGGNGVKMVNFKKVTARDQVHPRSSR